MKSAWKLTPLLAFVLVATEVAAKSPPGAAITPEGTAWSSKMRALEHALNQVLIDISNDERFDDKKNFKSIERNVKELAKHAAAVKEKNGRSPDKDPSIDMIGSDFADEAAYAAKSYAAGHRAYARVILGSMTNYCVACHTRTNTGPSFAGIKIDPRIEGINPFAKGNYFVAIREFDRALAEFEKIAADGEKAKSRLFDYERALRAGLSVAVRVKRDPDVALRLVDYAIRNPGSPFFLREQAGEWKKSLLEWKAEKASKSTDAEKLFAEATRLTAKARETQKFPADRSADMLYLRASGVVHELLGLGPKGRMASNALYLAGLSYDVLNDYGIKDFSEYYYRDCIRISPHTDVAKACYRRYEESVYFGYTGSGGTYIPSDVRARLNSLELLSAPEADLKAKGSPLQ